MRRPDWERRLATALRNARGKRFAWGGFDCCTFAADCIEAVADRDVLGAIRHSYRSKREAAAARRAMGGRRLADTVALCMESEGLAAIEPAYARAGDLVIVRGVPGIVLPGGLRAAVVIEGAGEGWQPAAPPWSAAWRIG